MTSHGRRLCRLLLTLCVAALLAACSEETGTGGRPIDVATSASTPIALAPDGQTLWVVNPDADSVSVLPVGLDPSSLTTAATIAVGAEPWAVAVAPDGTAVVLNRGSGSLSFVSWTSAEGAVVSELAVGAEPGGLAMSADGSLAYVTLSGDARVAVVDVAARRVVGSVEMEPLPWAVAVTSEGDVVVSHRLAMRAELTGTVAETDRVARLSVLSGPAAAMTVRTVDLSSNAFGFPNALEAMVAMGSNVYVAHQLNSPEPPNTFNTSVSGGLSLVSLEGSQPEALLSQDLNDPGFSTPTNFPRAIAASPDGETVYVALAGTNAVMGVDVSDPAAPSLVGFWPAGTNPRGITVSQDGSTGYVMNYLSRDVSVLDLNAVDRREVARIPVVDETLDAQILRGKALFNNASDPRLSRNGWVSCASCHLDGGGDGTTWPREEGHRQTMPLWSLEGTAPFHAAATRDELQDFEVDIERFMSGVGLAPGEVGHLLGAPSAGASADLDALAAFVLTGVRTPAAPALDAAAVTRGRAVFETKGCHSCHSGPAWTNSSLPGDPGTLPSGATSVVAALHDVGTYDPATDITGAQGFDVPTLLGLAYTAPYFHDGSAATLFDVLSHVGHSGPALSGQDADDLVTFLLSIDGDSEPF